MPTRAATEHDPFARTMLFPAQFTSARAVFVIIPLMPLAIRSTVWALIPEPFGPPNASTDNLSSTSSGAPTYYPVPIDSSLYKLCCHLRSKVLILLFNPFADLKADKAKTLCSSLFKKITHFGIRVAHEGLVQ